MSPAEVDAMWTHALAVGAVLGFAIGVLFGLEYRK